MRRAQAHRRDERREIVVHEHQRRGFARDVRAAPAHRDADVRGLERGRIVHAVAGHGDHFAVRLERLHQTQLVLGLGARVDVHRARTRDAAPRPSSASSSAPVSAPPRVSNPACAAIASAVPG